MNIPKDKIMELLHSQGDSDKATQAEGELPDQVDTDNPEHKSMLDKLGIDPSKLMGGAGGGIGSKLGL